MFDIPASGKRSPLTGIIFYQQHWTSKHNPIKILKDDCPDTRLSDRIVLPVKYRSIPAQCGFGRLLLK
jgi:hypothetical protein